jgi:hypothetical protein
MGDLPERVEAVTGTWKEWQRKQDGQDAVSTRSAPDRYAMEEKKKGEGWASSLAEEVEHGIVKTCARKG